MAVTEPRPTATQKRYRTLAVVKQEAITRVEKQLEDSVFVWPHLLVREFLATMVMTVALTVVSIVIDAPLRAHSDPNLTPTSTNFGKIIRDNGQNNAARSLQFGFRFMF